MKKSGLVWILAGFALLALLAQAAHAADVRVDSTNYYPSPAKPGQPFDLWVHVKNNSNANAESVAFRLVLSDRENNRTNYPFSLGSDDSPERSLGAILANQSALVKYKIFVDNAALNGTYDLAVEVGDNGQYSFSSKIPISVLAQNPQIELVESPAAELSPGQPAGIELVLKNTGNAKAVDILVGMVEDRTVTSTGVVIERQISALGTTQDYISSIPVGESQVAALTLLASGAAEAKAYTIPIQLRWKDENWSSYSATRYIGVEVSVLPEVDLVLGAVKPNSASGALEVGFNIYNAGPAAAKNVVVELSSSAAQSMSDSKIFIGTLESDDSTTFKSTFTLKPGLKPGSYPIEARVSLKDSQFRALSVTKTLQLEVSAQKQAEGGIPWAVIAAAAAIIIVGLALFLRGKGKARRK